MAKKLQASICPDFWRGRGRFSKTAMARTMAYAYNPDSPKGAGTTAIPGDVDQIPAAQPIKEG